MLYLKRVCCVPENHRGIDAAFNLWVTAQLPIGCAQAEINGGIIPQCFRRLRQSLKLTGDIKTLHRPVHQRMPQSSQMLRSRV